MEEPEFRIYVESLGDVPAAKDIHGTDELNHMLSLVRNAHPLDIIYIREVTESVVRVIRPGETIEIDGKVVDNGFHFTS